MLVPPGKFVKIKVPFESVDVLLVASRLVRVTGTPWRGPEVSPLMTVPETVNVRVPSKSAALTFPLRRNERNNGVNW